MGIAQYRSKFMVRPFGAPGRHVTQPHRLLVNGPRLFVADGPVQQVLQRSGQGPCVLRGGEDDGVRPVNDGTEALHLGVEGMAIVIGIEGRQGGETIIDMAIDAIGCDLGSRSE